MWWMWFVYVVYLYEYVYVCGVCVCVLQGLNVHMSSSNATREHPLVVVARQGLREIVFSWHIPYFPES